MSLVSNAHNVAFSTRWPSDKIVGVWEGTFNRATDVTKITGSFGDIYVYKIAHGFNRPLAVDLLWKISGGWADGGSTDTAGDISIAYSDSTYIYIVSSLFATAVGTFYYKVIANWITDYDNTNPLVASYVSSNKTKLFDTSVNYQKIYAQDVLSFTADGVKPGSHNLGYRPNFRVFYEAFSGQVWPMYAGGSSNPFLYDAAMVECAAWVDAANVNVYLSTVSGTKRAWYKVYLDT